MSVSILCKENLYIVPNTGTSRKVVYAASGIILFVDYGVRGPIKRARKQRLWLIDCEMAGNIY